MKVRSVKHRIVAVALTLLTACAGMVGQAQAVGFSMNPMGGDLVLAIYGNSTEALYNLGDFTQRLAPGATFSLDVSAGLTAAGGINPVKYTVIGFDISLPNGQVHAATTLTPSQIPNSGAQLLSLVGQFNDMAAWAGQIQIPGNTIPKSDMNSFSSRLNALDAGLLNGSWTRPMEGRVGQTVNIMRGDVAADTFFQVGSALLTSNGQLTIGNPGPILVSEPSSVMFLATGLIGLVGVARRSFKRMA